MKNTVLVFDLKGHMEHFLVLVKCGSERVKLKTINCRLSTKITSRMAVGGIAWVLLIHVGRFILDQMPACCSGPS